MNIYRVGPFTVATIGTIATGAVVTTLAILLVLPAKKQFDAAEHRYLVAARGAGPYAYIQAKTELDNANNHVALLKAQWAQTQSSQMPPYDVSDRVRAMDQLTYELTQNLGPDLEHHLRSYHGLMTADFTLPTPPATPNTITSSPVAIPLGTVTSRGTMQGVLNQFRGWRHFNRVILLDNLALHGNSPFIQATYTATVFILPKNDNRLPPPIPQAGEASPNGTQGNPTPAPPAQVLENG